jgi:hypothetical protein
MTDPKAAQPVPHEPRVSLQEAQAVNEISKNLAETSDRLAAIKARIAAPQEPAEPVASCLPELPAPDFGNGYWGDHYSPDAMKAFGFQCFARGVMAVKAQSVADAQDAWLEKLFVRKWNGVIDSGSRFNWELRGDWRHYIKNMEGETFARAIESAITKRDPKG